ncbi:MAG: TlpA disulfide reductase family protein [Aggregatilineales bacterium]
MDSARLRPLLLLLAFASLAASLWLVRTAGLPQRADYTGFAIGALYFAPELDALAPPFTAPSINGDAIDLLALRGGPVIVNFWATWCAPCRAEMLELETLFRRDNGHGLRVIGVNLQEPRQAVAAWVDTLGLTFDIALDDDGAIAARYQLRGQPSTYVIAPNGVITAIFYGPTTAERLRRAITPYLAET